MATIRVSNGDTFHSPKELADHLPLYDPPCIIVAFAWDLGKMKTETFSSKSMHTRNFLINIHGQIKCGTFAFVV